VIIKLDDIDIMVLEEFILYLNLTSYKFSKISGVPNATSWRVFNRLAELGLIRKTDKGFIITPRGVVITFLHTNKENIKRSCLSLLKKFWNYNGNEEDLKCFLEDVCKVLKLLKLSPFTICFNQPVTVATMLYNRMENLREESKRVIADIFLNFFPSVDLSNGCKAIISYDHEGKPYALVAKCKKEGVKLNYYCPEISKYLGKMNNELLQKLH